MRPVRYRDFNSSASIFTYLTPTRISLQHHTWTYLSVLCFTCLRLGLHTSSPVVKVDRRIRWHHTTTILRLRIGARLTRYRNCKFDNFARTISRHADGISRYSVPPSAGPLLPLPDLPAIYLSTCLGTAAVREAATAAAAASGPSRPHPPRPRRRSSTRTHAGAAAPSAGGH